MHFLETLKIKEPYLVPLQQDIMPQGNSKLNISQDLNLDYICFCSEFA